MANKNSTNDKKKAVKRAEQGEYQAILKLVGEVDESITYNNVREFCLGRSVIPAKRKIIAAARRVYQKNKKAAAEEKIAALNSK